MELDISLTVGLWDAIEIFGGYLVCGSNRSVSPYVLYCSS